MRRSFSFACLLLAWLCANGAMLDVVQVFAWGRMFAGYVHSLPVSLALRQTFDGQDPCPLCIAVQKARAAGAEQAPAPPPPAAKLILFSQPTDAFVPPVISSRELESDPPPWLTRRDPVPVPPPRCGVVAIG